MKRRNAKVRDMLSQSEVNELRRDFPALQQRHPRNGRPPVYFDNSCVTLTPRPVAQAVWDYSTKYPGCGGHRSGHWFSALTHDLREEQGSPDGSNFYSWPGTTWSGAN
jgi:cysteine desulfurase/selenocysteine lyase